MNLPFKDAPTCITFTGSNGELLATLPTKDALTRMETASKRSKGVKKNMAEQATEALAHTLVSDLPTKLVTVEQKNDIKGIAAEANIDANVTRDTANTVAANVAEAKSDQENHASIEAIGAAAALNAAKGTANAGIAKAVKDQADKNIARVETNKANLVDAEAAVAANADKVE